MTIVSRAQVRAAVVRAVMLGARPDEAISSVAQAFGLSYEDVLACWYADQREVT